MNDRDNLFKGKEKKYFILTLLPCLIIFLLIIFYLIINDKKETKNTVLKFEKHAVVKKVYISNNHNFIYVKYSNGEDMIREYGVIEKDSISKMAGDSFLYIFRQDSVFRINLLLYYKLN